MQWTDRIGRRIKLHDLHLLLAAVELGSMGRAAQRLNTSQPAISRAISELEHALGVPLLERGPQGIEPTSYGRTLLESATQAFDALRAGVNHIGAMADPAAGGEIRVGGNETIIAALLPKILAQLRGSSRNVTVHVRHVTSATQQVWELRERKLDLILGRVLLPYDDDIEAEVLQQEATHVVAGAANTWSRRRREIALLELADQPWALPPPETLAGALIADVFRANGVPYPPKNVVFGNVYTHCSLVADGGFLAILPGSVVQQNGERFGMRVLPVRSPVAAAPIGLLHLKRRELPLVVSQFIALARRLPHIGALAAGTSGS